MEEPTNITYEEGFVAPELIKWPAMVVQGQKVSREMAADILIRTDSNLPDFTYAGNDRAFRKALNALFGIPDGVPDDDWKGHWDRLDYLKKKTGRIDLSYLSNNRIVSSWVGGPHGWINWDGSIFSNNSNIGKWPSVSEVAADWAVIAATWPELDLVCQLYQEETGHDGDNEPVVEFVVKNAHVLVRAPQETLAPPVDTMFTDIMGLFSPMRERGIDIPNLRHELKRLYGDIPQYSDMPAIAED